MTGVLQEVWPGVQRGWMLPLALWICIRAGAPRLPSKGIISNCSGPMLPHRTVRPPCHAVPELLNTTVIHQDSRLWQLLAPNWCCASLG